MILGAEVFFARDGASDSPSTVSKTQKPASNSAAWLSLGKVLDFSFTPKIDELIIRAPVDGGGHYEDDETIVTGQQLLFSFTLKQHSELTFESIFLGEGAVTLGTAFTPLKQAEKIKGFFKITAADQTDTGILENYLWANFSVEQLQMAEKQYQVKVNGRVLSNSLNTIKVEDWTA